MTDPTWKDPLLRRMTWSGNVRVAIETWPYAPRPEWPALAVYDWLASHWPGTPDLARLRSLIDAELARGREAVEVLRGAEWSGKSTNGGYPCCPECDGIWDVREKYPDHEPIPKWAGMVGHAPDCRLAKVIGG